MATQSQHLFKNLINPVQFNFQSDDFHPIIKDGKMFVYKVQLEDIYTRRLEQYPYKNKTYNNFIQDLKTMYKRNRYMLPFVEETDTFLIFECGNFQHIDVNNINAATPALKKYLQFNRNVENDLNNYYLEQMVYDPYTNRVKIIDLSSLWYGNFLSKEDDHKHKDVGILSLPFDDNTRHIISFLEKNPTNDVKLQKYITNTNQNNKQYKIFYV